MDEEEKDPPDTSKLDLDEVMEAAKRSTFDLDNPGFCTACGEDASNVEPDAERYRCETCGEKAVYGAEQLLIYMGS